MLVDDQELIRTGFTLVLSAEPGIRVVAEAGDGVTALSWLRDNGTPQREAADVVLMDVRMSGMNGIETTREITTSMPDVRVLVLTTFDLDEYAIRAIEAGASGFLLKDARPTELVDAIHRVHSGDAVMAPSMTKRMIERMSLAAAEAEHPPPARHPLLDALTEREREVLELMAQGLNNSEIQETMFLTESTVKTHVGRIFQKLQVRDRVHAVLFAKQHGL